MKAIWISRPPARAGDLAAALSRRGWRPLPLPAMRIAAPPDDAAMREYLAAPRRFDLHIFVSAEAARRIGARLSDTTGAGAGDKMPALAIGAATAAALPAPYRALPPAESAESAEDSRALLRHAALQTPPRHIAVLGGAGADGAPPAPLLCRVLRARGGEVLAAACYRRCAAAADAALSARGRAGEIAAAVAYSGDTARFMLAMTAPDNGWLLRLPLFVIHRNIARAAARLGFARVITAAAAALPERIDATLAGGIMPPQSAK